MLAVHGAPGNKLVPGAPGKALVWKSKKTHKEIVCILQGQERKIRKLNTDG